MATAEELLNGSTGYTPDHSHIVGDPDTYFIIDPDTRRISNSSSRTNILMQRDHNSERFTFELPRYVEEHDMLLCNRVYAHYNNIEVDPDTEAKTEHPDVHQLLDLRENPDNPDTVICSWLVRREATWYAGSLSFFLQYMCVEGGEITYEWHTDEFEDIVVKRTRRNESGVIEPHVNLLEQWRQQLFSVRKFEITLPAESWIESDDGVYWTQTVDIDARENGRIDLHPTAQQLIEMLTDGITMFVANEDGVVTVYSVVTAPNEDLTIIATETVEVYE